MWLILPPNPSPITFCPSVPARAGSTSLSGSQCEMLARSATSRGTSRPPEYWARVWLTAPYTVHLSGLTCPPSTAARGVDLWIASLAAIRASPTVSPDLVLDPAMTAFSSTNLFGSSPKCGLRVYSAKTSRGTPTASSPHWFRHWKNWAIALRREFSARGKWGLPTAESDCTLWQTPVADDAPDRDQGKINSRGEPKLSGQVKLWPTPKAHQRSDCRAERQRKTPDLSSAVITWPTPMAGTPAQRGNSAAGNSDFSRGVMAIAGGWPTPAAQNYKGSSPGSSIRKNGESRMSILSYAAEQGFPSSRLALPMMPGLTSSRANRFWRRACLIWTSPPLASHKALLTWARRTQKRRLNPYFVEWLMGWPIGLTDCGRSVTGFAQWQARSRSYLCQLIFRGGEA